MSCSAAARGPKIRSSGWSAIWSDARISASISSQRPSPLVQQLIDQADIKPGMSVLEPSAGKGDIADLLAQTGAKVDVVELSSTLRPILKAKGHKVVGHDFDTFEPPSGGYDRVVMNPPFSDGMDADHVRRAYDMLKPGGRLVAITGEGIHFRTDKKSAAFREWLDLRGGVATKLPEGSFKSAFRPTGVATRVVVVDKPRSWAETDSQPAARGEARNFGWDGYELHKHYTFQELYNWQRDLLADWAAEDGGTINRGTSLHIAGADPKRRRAYDGLSSALGMHAQAGDRAKRLLADLDKSEGPLDRAVRMATAKHGRPVTAAEVAPHWPEADESLVLDGLHAQPGAYRQHDGERWAPVYN